MKQPIRSCLFPEPQSSLFTQRCNKIVSLDAIMLPIGQHDDCGLLAIRNATLDDSLNLDGLLSVVRPLQKDLEESVVSADTSFLEKEPVTSMVLGSCIIWNRVAMLAF